MKKQMPDESSPSVVAEEPSAEPWIKRLATDGVFLAVLSGLGYWIAFAYESGYASHFGYPTFLIAPSVTSIIVAISAVAGALMGLAPILMDLFRSGESTTRKLAYWVLMLGLLLFVGAHTLLTSNYSWKSLWRVAAVVAFFFLVRWASQLQDKAGSKVNLKASMILFALVVGMILNFFSTFSGLLAAKDQNVFYFLANKPDYAVVRVYDGMTIAVRFNSQTNSFTGEYLVLKLGDELKEMNLKRVALTAPRLPVLKSGEP